MQVHLDPGPRNRIYRTGSAHAKGAPDGDAAVDYGYYSAPLMRNGRLRPLMVVVIAVCCRKDLGSVSVSGIMH